MHFECSRWNLVSDSNVFLQSSILVTNLSIINYNCHFNQSNPVAKEWFLILTASLRFDRVKNNKVFLNKRIIR